MLQINSDLGEGFDAVDAALIPLIDQASIACGGHAGNEASMRKCLLLAKKHQTLVGAHPSYPDKENFGRRSLLMATDELASSISAQILTLLNYCDDEGIKLSYVKPHGALYNDMVSQSTIFHVLCEVVKNINAQLVNPLKLMVPSVMQHNPALSEGGLSYIFEGFADRAYKDGGELVSRSNGNAVHQTQEVVLAQVAQFAEKGGVYSENNLWLPMPIDTLCVHGDTVDALALVSAIRAHLEALL